MVKQLNIRLDSWQGRWLVVAALLAGVVLLWVGFALALVCAVVAAAALFVSRLRGLLTRRPAFREPAVIEGQYTEIRQ